MLGQLNRSAYLSGHPRHIVRVKRDHLIKLVLKKNNSRLSHFITEIQSAYKTGNIIFIFLIAKKT